MKSSLFSKLVNKDGEWLEDKAEESWVYHVNTPHLLIQAAGYLKHVHGQKTCVGIFYRGQETLHKKSLQPTLYRGGRSHASLQKKSVTINKYIERCGKDCSVLRPVPKFAWEPLLQHYGIKTTWIDIVDNVWVALWFACNKTYTTGANKSYLHFEQRNVDKEKYAYIVLVEAGFEQVKNKHGYYSNNNTELVDLRIAAPSTFIRPHAQHGLLARAKTSAGSYIGDYRDMIVGVIRVNLSDALVWLGNGMLLTPHALFPSPVYDSGYLDLLNYAPPPPGCMGAIQHIGV